MIKKGLVYNVSRDVFQSSMKCNIGVLEIIIFAVVEMSTKF